ncbi:ribonuclease E inhibitor RraB [Planctobacterium marinum]|uniref:ribonuclease E inhibitor RraB n=1 Tax=Planctobacterium marinum TaxID=1631968 RepID=UPI001E3C7108|nr:ribonuclease E inhibitor RraB [Planctobacterium marinum]MCC2606850.1 ribonuclease E inhibitor RraB [Planctobacterium marinum]
MPHSNSLQDWYQFNQETLEALINDGSAADKPHTIEHHIASKDFALLEKAAVDAYKAGFEVTDAEELILDDGDELFSFDAIAERSLDLEQINADTSKLVSIAEKHKVFYDGWGTYFVE